MKKFDKYILEKFKINSNTINDNIKKDIYFTEPDNNDEWTEECIKCLKEEFIDEYFIEQKFTGSIAFYIKGRKPSLKTLVCIIRGIDKNKELIGDFGSNFNLNKKLKDRILNVINNI